MAVLEKVDGVIWSLSLIWRLAKYIAAMLFVLACVTLVTSQLRGMEGAHGWLWTLGLYAATGIFGRIFWLRSGLQGLFGGGQKSGSMHDVHETALALQKLVIPYQFTKEEYCTPVFVGRVGTGKKVRSLHLPVEVFQKNHVAILGASGTGKSKIAAWITSQLHLEGSAVIVIDPKDDEYMARILVDQAEATGKKFIYIDLNKPVPQINPFLGASRDDAEEMLQAALQLDPSGNPAVDFHRGEDRDGCATLISTGKTNILDLIAVGAGIKDVTSKTNFWRELKTLGRVEAFHTDEGPNLADEIQDGSIIYIVGSTDNLRVIAAQKMLLARFFQIIKRRSKSNATQVCMFLDEFKYSLSNCVMRALGTIRDKRCNMILAYQSEGDLNDSGGLDPKAVIGAVNGNTTLKFVYKLEDVQTAKSFVEKAGKERIQIETTSKLLEDGLEAGSWREGDRDAVTVDMLTTNMPKPLAGQASVCWVFGIGPAFPLSTMHMIPADQPEIVAAKALKPLENSTLNAQASIDFPEPILEVVQEKSAQGLI